MDQSAAARRFSTDMFVPRERLSAWRDFVGRAIFKLDIEPYSDRFRAETTFRSLPGIGFCSGRTTASRHGRRPHMVDNDDMLFSMPFAGTSRFATCGREAVVGQGDAVWVGGGEAGFQETHGDFGFVSLQVPKRALRGAVANLEDSICRRIPAEAPALRLLRLYVDTLAAGENPLRPEAQRVIAAHVVDLIAAALGATSREATRSDGLRAAQLQAIKQDIEASLDQPGLSTATIAARHRMSPRQLRYGEVLMDDTQTCLAPEMQRLATTHVYDLVALALGAGRDAAQAAAARGGQAARLRAIKADIEDNLARPDLSAATIAARHRVPLRYLQRLFEADGISCTEYVLKRRLARAHQLLREPQSFDQPISAIAFAAGFGHLSRFNRAFRSRFGQTPSDMRIQAQREDWIASGDAVLARPH